MTVDEGYRDWRSLELAMKEAAKRVARNAGPGVSAATVDAQLRQARFDRFLSRVFAAGEESGWMLKGGMSMLARVPAARSTRDMDLAAGLAADLQQAEEELVGAVDVDLGDHITFRLARSTATGLGDNQPGVVTRRFVFTCIDVHTDREIDTVQVDVVVGPAPVGRPELVEPANRLRLRRPLVTFPYRLYPVVDQIADKVCATMDTHYPGGLPSSRVKDLVDLVMLAGTQKVDLDELRLAIAARCALSELDAFERFEIPADWIRSYPRMAAGVPFAREFSAAEAEAFVAQLVNPALQPAAAGTGSVWVPGAGWTASDAVNQVEAAVAAELAVTGDVYVHQHIRGWPVRQHRRAARGGAVSENEEEGS